MVSSLPHSPMSDFENYRIEDEEEKDIKRITLWSVILRVMTMPTSGWERVKKRGPSPDIASLRFLLPVSLLSGASEFFSLLYQPGQVEFAGIMVAGVISFFSYFLGYYLSLLLAKLFLPKVARYFPSTDYGKLVAMTGVSSLAIFHLVYKALPIFDFILEFLPIWTIFMVFKGMQIAGIEPEKAAFSMGVMCLVVIASPVLLESILSLFV